jgi:hypothetical protein
MRPIQLYKRSRSFSSLLTFTSSFSLFFYIFSYSLTVSFTSVSHLSLVVIDVALPHIGVYMDLMPMHISYFKLVFK